MRVVRQDGLQVTEAAFAVAGACALSAIAIMTTTATKTTGKKTGS